MHFFLLNIIYQFLIKNYPPAIALINKELNVQASDPRSVGAGTTGDAFIQKLAS